MDMRLVNVKGFSDTGKIALCPITILIGQNSSGKSSIMRFPLVLRQTLLDDSMAPLLFYGKSIDYGSFHDVVFHHEAKRRIEFRVTLDPSFLESAYRRRLIRATREMFGRPLVMRVQIGRHEDSLIVYKFSLGLDAQDFVSVSRRRDGRYQVIGYRLKDRRKFEFLTSHLTFDKFIPDFREMVLEARSDKDAEAHYDFLDETYDLLLVLNSYWNTFANSVSYIGPFRRTPERAYRHKDNAVLHVGVDGELAPVVLAQNLRARGQLVRDVSKWLQENLHYSLRVEDLGGDMFRLLVADEETGVENNIIDVGHGLSQLIPIVIQTFMPKRPSSRRSIVPAEYDLIVVEQPELHLHPAAQTHLADLFVEGISRGSSRKHFLIETHSEHMLLRLRRYVVEGKLNPQDIAIYYTYKDSETGSNHLKRLSIREDGSIPEWPKGFFDKDFEEVMLMRRALSARGLKGDGGK